MIQFLLIDQKFMPGFIYSALFLKNKEQVQKLEHDKACFQYDRLIIIIKIQLKLRLTKHYEIKPLKLKKI